ncbi:SusD/RagB family nutrient-binding outer membrane lipoprotein [Capnocytophaga cynodegmi]|uniref:SusD/RagB family nutrient-binding outer membrane lipoprotein n=1 Tax=Capnocytophaga cynodegmi TaxID=28189 RepID=UPI001AD3DCAD|nr:SusD/RagB family nutrient-binding outer membrane lipoprotein [Capnocytophaga cynodegmi]GIM53472.1 hypothetical protein CAPN005_01190 [Capnocytophaga cynodegmi]
MKKIVLLITTMLAVGCSREDFADKNTDPSTLSEPDLRFSTAKVIETMYTDDYTIWFYDNFDYIFPWSQLTTSGLGNGLRMNEMENVGGHNLYGALFPNARDIRARIDAMPSTDKEKFRALRAITFPAVIHPALSVTDKYGSLVYSQAALAPYTTPPLLTPEYDNQEQLFDTWLKELDEAIAELSTTSGQLQLGAQDVVYNGDYKKWAKFCNLLKLKIAARLVNVNKSKAIKIAEEVVNSPVGYMNELADDFVYRRSIKYYGTGNGTQPGSAAEPIVDFMVANKDPRLRFIFTKNHFNSEVIDAFAEAKKELPPHVKKHVNLKPDNKFDSWKEPGEPWVRYVGVPISPDKTNDVAYDEYFKQGERNKINLGGVEKTYASTSSYSERNTRTGYNYSYPTKPGGRVIEVKDNYPPINIVLGSSGETNLFLAEFKLLGANLPQSAQDYFNQGVRLSVQRMDAIAKNNQLAYYEEDPVYTEEKDKKAGSIKLKEGEIENLLMQPAYNVTTDGLEKVYIQQYINYATAASGDIWTTVRRSGYPKKNSTYLAWGELKSAGNDLVLPRRFLVRTPTEDDKNYQNTKKAIDEQGFTSGTNDPQILNTQRLWFDKQNPNYGGN